LEAASASSGQHHGSADALAVAGRVAHHCQQIAAQREIELQVSGAPGRIAIDGDLAERILLLLIENACRHGRTRATVEVSRNGTTVTVAVTDDGKGVPESQRASIFEPGVIGEHASGGSDAGLGLTLARRLARSAGGEITAEPGTGGHFVVQLPAS